MALDQVPVTFNDRVVGVAYESVEPGVIYINVTDPLFSKWISSGVTQSISIHPEPKTSL